jgi:thermitase
VIVVGSVFDGTSHNFKTVKYSATGQLEWQEEYDGLSGNDKALDLLVDSDGKVYVSGTSGTGSGNTYTTVKYAYTTLQNGNHILGDGTALCKSGELLVKFRSRYVYTNVVDDTKWQFGTLDQLVPTPIANAIGDALGLPSGTGGRIKTYKVFRNLTTADSISITRLGDEERIPSFWSTFLLEVDLTAEPMSVVDAVNEVTQYLEYAQLNYLYKPLSDPLYPTRQQSLTPSAQYPTGDINIEPAWTITTGRPEVKVGVVDELIEYWHPEFMMAGSMASKIIYGFSYFYNEEMTDVLGPDLSNSYPHGTACAGVIGAIRNNEEGIAGIAGGDADLGEYGCSLISLGIFNAENIATTSFVANALLEGSLDLNASGNSFACHVLNNSWGANGFQAFDQEIRKAAYQVYRNECVFVAAKGNGGNPPHYPADYGPEWSKISVGASGWDGSLMTLGNGGYAVTYGGSMDLIAPGAQEMITSTVGQYVNFPFWAECAPLPARYSCFRASSSAAAHASGVAALMLSEHNVLSGYANGLAPEDVEQIMEKGATDISGPPWNNPNYTAGFDPYNGWGRLNAGESVRLVHTPYRVFHSGTPQLSTVSGQQQTINVYSNVGWNNTWDLDEGLHTVVPITVTHTYVNDFGPNTTVLDGLGGQPGYWPRHSSTVGLLEFMGEQTATWDFELVGNVLYVTATTMCFKVITQPNGEPINRFIPAPAEQLRTPYSVHLLDEFTVGQNESEHAVQLSVYPNPANDMVNISWQDLHPDKLVVYDARGRVVADVMLGSFPKVVTLSTGGWSPGLYTVMVSSPAGRAAQRFQKH